jgi:hypothetical protein
MKNFPARTVIVSALALSLSAACANTPVAPGPAVSPDPGISAAASAPVLLALAPNCGALDLVVAKGTLFWTERNTGRVNSLPTTGGAPMVLAANQALPGPIAVDDTAVFWANAGDKALMRLDRPSGTPTVLVLATHEAERGVGLDADDINGLLVADGTLYFGRFTDALKVPTTGGSPLLIGHSPDTRRGRPARFVADASYLYQTELIQYAISREALDGSQSGLLDDGSTRAPLAPDWMADSQGALVTDALALADGVLFWADGNTIVSHHADRIELPGEGPTRSRIGYSAAYDAISGFALVGDKIYLGETHEDTVEVLGASPPASDGSSPVAVVVARDQPNAGQFAADETNVYWRTIKTDINTGAQDCRIMKLAKKAP